VEEVHEVGGEGTLQPRRSASNCAVRVAPCGTSIRSGGPGTRPPLDSGDSGHRSQHGDGYHGTVERMILALVALAFAATPLVPFASEESIVRLDRATEKVDFFTLANHFESQENGGMCGPTTAVIVLNALRANNPAIEKPTDPTTFPASTRRTSRRPTSRTSTATRRTRSSTTSSRA
jgi:hypothetical protein